MAEETLETEIVKLATDTIKMHTAEITSLRAQLAEVRVAAYARGVEVGQGMASKESKEKSK